ncbi:MAG: class I tRNA ligase family protein [Parcubacteria group bacterium]|jgi:leucyl-tRNA synthetase
MEKYNPKKIEEKWAKKWIDERTFTPDLLGAKNPYYALFMFPYPSAEGLHIGNFYAFTSVDVMAKYKKLRGFDVFEPIGWDAFGIHSENYALKIGETPSKMLERTINNFRVQIQSAGLSCDWTREVNTTSPEYYRWTQWIFAKLFEKGLAYQKEALVNWCPDCKTVLADEQIEADGLCERCKAVVEKRKMKQWFFKITEYAQRLLSGLDDMDWSEITKSAQKNWIGKSEGARIKFKIDKSDLEFEVFTTRADTLFGCTYCVLSPEHELVLKITTPEQKEAVKKYIESAVKKPELERKESKEKTGVFTGAYAINPINGEKVPVWVADYVLSGYGTGAVMAVPAHDERDFEFAKKYDLPIKKVIESNKSFVVTIKSSLNDEFYKQVRKFTTVLDGTNSWESLSLIYTEEVDKVFDLAENNFVGKLWYIHSEGKIKKILFHNGDKNKRFSWKTEKEHKEAYDYGFSTGVKKEQLDWKGCYASFTDDGVLINSEKYNNLTSEKAREEITKWMEENQTGKKEINYKLRDWCISRQRYWGPPIPVVYCAKCGTVAIPEKDLPVELPDLKEGWEPAGNGKGPLANVESFVKTNCPICGGLAEREADVMDNFLDSAWYFFRYISSENNKEIFDKKMGKKWLPVDIYIGGNEHAVLHLMYTRFITMFFHDLGLTDFDNPFKRFRANGMILKDGKKMSKSKGNVVNPEEYGEKIGYDALKIYLLFLGPLSEDRSFSDEGIMGARHWAERVFNLNVRASQDYKDDENLIRKLYKTVKAVADDMENQKYNTSIAKLMEMTNVFYGCEKISVGIWEKFLIIVSIFLPALSEELWEKLGHEESIFKEKWPEYDLELIKDEEIELVIQINGKLRDRIKVPADISEGEVKKLAMESEKIKNFIGNKEIKKVIFVKGKLINIVI